MAQAPRTYLAPPVQRPAASLTAPAARPAAPPRPAAAGLSVATLFADASVHASVTALQGLARILGVPLDTRMIPATLARAGNVGRIGVPGEAAGAMLQQGVVIGSTFGGDALAPVSRLFRGLQRRADVVVDVRPMVSLPGLEAGSQGFERDVLLFSQRTLDRPVGTTAMRGNDDLRQQARARDAAMLAYRLCAAERRKLMLVLPVGRGTRAQHEFAEALQQHAIAQRLAPPRIVKAGLLTALLSGESARDRWLVASVIPIEELSAMVGESLGATMEWPVLSYGRGASFYDLPVQAATDPVPLLLVLVSLLQRSGRSELAQQLLSAVMLTCAARTRMAAELGVPSLAVPIDDFVRGVRANWGRTPVTPSPRERRSAERDPLGIAGLRLRIESALTATAVREAVTSALEPTGLEVASVRSVESAPSRGRAAFDVRVRGRLGEPRMGDASSHFMLKALGPAMRCVAVEPWAPGAGIEPSRMRDGGGTRTRVRSAEQP